MKIKHIYKSIIPRLLQVDAITLAPFIFYRRSKEDTPSSTVFHEMVHIEQIKYTGWIRFYLSYLLYYIAGRVKGYPHNVAYFEIPYEKEAYARENQHRSSIKNLI